MIPFAEKQGLVEYAPIQWAAEPVKGDHAPHQAYGGVTVLGYEKDRWFGYFPYMPVGFFRRLGFSEVDREGSRVLLHLDLGAAGKPSLMRPRMRQAAPTASTGHVVEVLHNSQCPWSGG